MKKLLSTIIITLAAVGCYSVSITPAPRPSLVTMVKTYWALGVKTNEVAAVGLLPTTAPDYAEAMTTPGTNIFYSTNTILLGKSTAWFTNTNGILEVDFVITNMPEGLVFAYGTDNLGNVSDNNPEATNIVRTVISPATGTTVTK